MTMTYTAPMPTAGIVGASQQQTSAPSTVTAGLQLRQGPVWGSWEQLRVGGSKALANSMPQGTVGRLHTKDGDYAVLVWGDFDRLYGMAQDVIRLSQGVMLLHQAAEVVLTSEQLDLGVRMIRDLTLQYQLPAASNRTLPPLEVEGEDDQEGAVPDLEHFSPPRPNWG